MAIIQLKQSGSAAQGRDQLQSNEEVQELTLPFSVNFIVGNEFCERFSYYGMRTVLALYLVVGLAILGVPVFSPFCSLSWIGCALASSR
jgi:dipeptide/tripeptide permease